MPIETRTSRATVNTVMMRFVVGAGMNPAPAIIGAVIKVTRNASERSILKPWTGIARTRLPGSEASASPMIGKTSSPDPARTHRAKEEVSCKKAEPAHHPAANLILLIRAVLNSESCCRLSRLRLRTTDSARAGETLRRSNRSSPADLPSWRASRAQLGQARDSGRALSCRRSNNSRAQSEIVCCSRRSARHSV